MHPLAIQKIVASVKRRQEQGDCPTEPAFAVETLENTLVSLFDDYQKLRDAALVTATGPKGDPGVPPRAIVEGSTWRYNVHNGALATAKGVDERTVHMSWFDSGERKAWPIAAFREHFTWVSDPEATESATKETTP